MGTILISGASIAGPALALWLERYGFEVTVVEKAPEVRQGGQAVDFKGAVHRAVLQRMGVYEQILEARAPQQGGGIIVDARGRKIGTIPAEFSGGDIEIARGDLANILFDRTKSTCEYVFGDSIAAIEQLADGVVVDFERSHTRRFDLVIGADGIHSNVRRLIFGAEADHVEDLGYYYALAKFGDELSAQDAMYNEPGRMVATGGTKAPAFFVFKSNPNILDRDDVARQKQLLAEAYRGAAWKVPQLLAALPEATEFYIDSISRATVKSYAKGQVALVGDSAWGNALGGFGTGLAIVGAYVLGGELHHSGGDAAMAFARYESKFRSYAEGGKKVNAGALLAPSTRLGIWARNRLFSVAPLFAGVSKILDRLATNIDLESY